MKPKQYAFLFLILICQSQITVHALTPGDYNQKFWGGGLQVWLNYPEDASPSDTIDLNIYILSSKFPRGNQIESVQVKISVLDSTSSNTLYDNTILSNTYLQNGDDYNQTITVTLPSDSRWYVTTQIDTVSYQNDWENRQEAHVTLDCTEVKTNTYEDMEQQTLELEAYLELVNQNIINLQTQLNAIQNDETSSDLEQNYLKLVQDYALLSDRFNLVIQADQGVSDPNLVTQITEMTTSISQLEEEIMSKEAIINNLSNENTELQNGLNQQTIEIDETVATLETYKESHTVSRKEYDDLQSKLTNSNLTRNITLGILLLSISAILFLKYRN